MNKQLLLIVALLLLFAGCKKDEDFSSGLTNNEKNLKTWFNDVNQTNLNAKYQGTPLWEKATQTTLENGTFILRVPMQTSLTWEGKGFRDLLIAQLPNGSKQAVYFEKVSNTDEFNAEHFSGKTAYFDLNGKFIKGAIYDNGDHKSDLALLSYGDAEKAKEAMIARGDNAIEGLVQQQFCTAVYTQVWKVWPVDTQTPEGYAQPKAEWVAQLSHYDCYYEYVYVPDGQSYYPTQPPIDLIGLSEQKLPYDPHVNDPIIGISGGGIITGTKLQATLPKLAHGSSFPRDVEAMKRLNTVIENLRKQSCISRAVIEALEAAGKQIEFIFEPALAKDNTMAQYWLSQRSLYMWDDLRAVKKIKFRSYNDINERNLFEELVHAYQDMLVYPFGLLPIMHDLKTGTWLPGSANMETEAHIINDIREMMVNKGVLPRGYLPALDGREYELKLSKLMGGGNEGQLPRYPVDPAAATRFYLEASEKFPNANGGAYYFTKHDGNLPPKALLKLMNQLKNSNCTN